MLASACIDYLMQLNRPVEIVWIGRPPAINLLRSAYPSIHVVEFRKAEGAKRLWEIAYELRDLHFLVDLQVNLRSRALAGILKHRFAIRTFHSKKHQVFRTRLVAAARVRSRKRALPKSSQVANIFQFRTMVEALQQGLRWHLPADIFAQLEGATARPRLTIPASESTRPWQKELTLASYEAKRAPTSKFVEILVMLQHRIDAGDSCGILFLGDEADRAIASEVVNALRWPGHILNLAGRLSLWETAIALHSAKVLLSNDSSLAHIAEAVGTPASVIFGPTVEAFGFAPWRPESRVHSAPLGCRPCSKHGKTTCRFGDYQCFRDISSETIVGHLVATMVKNSK